MTKRLEHLRSLYFLKRSLEISIGEMVEGIHPKDPLIFHLYEWIKYMLDDEIPGFIEEEKQQETNGDHANTPQHTS